MPFDKKLACDFLKSISFERLGGTPEEAKAVKLICSAATKAGAVPQVETFAIQTFTKGTAGLEVISPYKKHYPAKPVALTGSFPKGGKMLPLVYFGATSLADMGNIKGKAIYGLDILANKQLEALKNTKVAALLNIVDFGYSLRYRMIGRRAPKQFRRTPIICIPFEAAMEMFKQNASKVRIHVEQGERKALSKNVVAKVAGTCPDLHEEILICAHHDSVPDSPGANDNAGGSAIMIALLNHFAKNPTRRTLRFVWFGSEEQGLLGSQAYVKAHEKELERVKMVINIDGAGRLLHPNYAIVTGRDDLKHFVERIGKQSGLQYSVVEGILSSDTIPFSLHDIPSINLTSGADHNLLVHTKNDAFKWSGANGLAPNGEIALEIIRRLGDARHFPFKRGFNETVGKSLKNYYKNSMRLSRKELPKWCK